MIKVRLDMLMPDSCYDCPLQTEPCGDCMIDLPKQRSTYPYCNPRNHWDPGDDEKYNKFLDRPVWCPLEKGCENSNASV